MFMQTMVFINSVAADGKHCVRASAIAHLNPHLPFVPGFLVNFVLKVASPFGFCMMKKVRHKSHCSSASLCEPLVHFCFLSRPLCLHLSSSCREGAVCKSQFSAAETQYCLLLLIYVQQVCFIGITQH